MRFTPRVRAGAGEAELDGSAGNGQEENDISGEDTGMEAALCEMTCVAGAFDRTAPEIRAVWAESPTCNDGASGTCADATDG